MAKNTGDGYRKGAVTGRTQFQHDDGQWQKRDERMDNSWNGSPQKAPSKA